MRIGSRLIVIIIVLVGALMSCDSGDFVPTCIEPMDIGEYELAPSSRSFIPYPSSVKKIVFEDSLGVEYPFDVTLSSSGKGLSSGTGRDTCEIDGSVITIYEYDTERTTFFIENRRLDVAMFVWLSAVAYPEEDNSFSAVDQFILSARTPIANSVNGLSLTVDSRGHSAFNTDEPVFNSFFLHNKEFQDVYATTAATSDEFSLYYSRDVGIVGLERELSNLSLSFLRIEE